MSFCHLDLYYSMLILTVTQLRFNIHRLVKTYRRIFHSQEGVMIMWYTPITLLLQIFEILLFMEDTCIKSKMVEEAFLYYLDSKICLVYKATSIPGPSRSHWWAKSGRYIALGSRLFLWYNYFSIISIFIFLCQKKGVKRKVKCVTYFFIEYYLFLIFFRIRLNIVKLKT